MAETAEKYWWTDKTVQIPKEVTIPGLPGEAKAVYLVMKSFGPESRAGLKALATRLVWSIDRARTWQQHLWEKGWIWLLTEGQGAAGGKGTPRQWWVASAPFEGPPQELVERVCKNATLPPQPWQNQEALEKGAPSKSPPETNKAPQAIKKSLSIKHEQQDAFWIKAQAIWQEKNPGDKLPWPAVTGFPAALFKALESWGGTELARRWENMVNDPFSLPDLADCVRRPERWINRRTKGGASARTFHSPEHFIPPRAD